MIFDDHSNGMFSLIIMETKTGGGALSGVQIEKAASF